MENPVGKIQLREFDKLTWVDPKQVLINLRDVELNFPDNLDDKVRRMRTNKLKEWREARDAALFTYGMSQKVLNAPTLLTKLEEKDFDFIMKWIKNEREYYYPVQLKELPPDDLNSNIQLDDIFKKLSKYSSVDDLSVAIKINREIKSFDLSPYANRDKLNICELWYFGCLSPEKSKWFLYGNVLKNNPGFYEFDYPQGRAK